MNIRKIMEENDIDREIIHKNKLNKIKCISWDCVTEQIENVLLIITDQ